MAWNSTEHTLQIKFSGRFCPCRSNLRITSPFDVEWIESRPSVLWSHAWQIRVSWQRRCSGLQLPFYKWARHKYLAQRFRAGIEDGLAITLGRRRYAACVSHSATHSQNHAHRIMLIQFFMYMCMYWSAVLCAHSKEMRLLCFKQVLKYYMSAHKTILVVGRQNCAINCQTVPLSIRTKSPALQSFKRVVLQGDAERLGGIGGRRTAGEWPEGGGMLLESGIRAA